MYTISRTYHYTMLVLATSDLHADLTTSQLSKTKNKNRQLAAK